MKQINIQTKVRKQLADIYTPVGIYLRLRDRFRDTILLESAEHKTAESNYSFICIHAIGGIEIHDTEKCEFKYPLQKPEKLVFHKNSDLAALLQDYMKLYVPISEDPDSAKFAQGLYGYLSFDAIPLIENIKFKSADDKSNKIPLVRYRLYQYVIVINHFKDELILCENVIDGLESEMDIVESLIIKKDVPEYPFRTTSDETSNISEERFISNVEKGIQRNYRGDVFQVVLSRRFQQSFRGDELNVYRCLRYVNPSPYLFFFDYGDYKLFGSSPEAQLVIKKGKAIVHPIAGTFKRTGNEIIDQQKAEALLKDPKENAEHVMLVDLSRNDLSTVCNNVEVTDFKKIQYYSHVIHLVSEVSGDIPERANPFEILLKTFPAGTLSGAPKFKALQIIDELETTNRSFYGGAIGFIGLNGSCNHAIMIRTFLSKGQHLFYQAGAGVVAASSPEKELQEVNNKINALRTAIKMAEGLS